MTMEKVNTPKRTSPPDPITDLWQHYPWATATLVLCIGVILTWRGNFCAALVLIGIVVAQFFRSFLQTACCFWRAEMACKY